MKHQGWGLWSGSAVPLSGQQIDLLSRYESLLGSRAIPGGMISASDADRLRERHLLDCLRAAPAIRRLDRSAVDIGSGAGLPGVVLAIACPWLAVTLVEGRRSRAAFLDLVVDELGLRSVEVLHGRVEPLTGSVDVCFARAFGSPIRSWEAAEPLLGANGRLLYWAGVSYDGSGLPADLRVEVVAAPTLASSGPLVMMCRQ